VIVFDQDNKPILIIGSAGGSRIIGYVAQRLISILDWNIPAAQALAMPSILARGTTIEAENGFDPHILRLLQAKGQHITQAPLNSGLTLIHHQNGQYIGAADPRREGTALGR
jgi:gamma-glutamyltranspeptidase/glutathione hydrolase